MRHFARVSRYGNGAVLQLDLGEGRFYAERWPTDEHRALRLESASGGGEVTHNVWTNEFDTQSIVDSKLPCCTSGPTFSKFPRKILGRFHILGKSQERRRILKTS